VRIHLGTTGRDNATLLTSLLWAGSKHDYAAVSITKWTRRRDRLLDEIRGLDADIYCLQEISAKALRETFIPNLKHVGLECFGFAPSKPADKVVFSPEASALLCSMRLTPPPAALVNTHRSVASTGTSTWVAPSSAVPPSST